jgi:hypothetical protein
MHGTTEDDKYYNFLYCNGESVFEVLLTSIVPSWPLYIHSSPICSLTLVRSNIRVCRGERVHNVSKPKTIIKSSYY